MTYCPNCGFKLTDNIPFVPEATQRGSSEEVGTEKELLEDYLGEKGDIAVPKVSDYRERYKTHKLRASDVKTNAPIVPLPRMDTEMDKFGDLVVGPGLEQEI